MATNDELMATIDAKLSTLLKLAVEGQSRPATKGPAPPTGLGWQAAPLEGLATNSSPSPAYEPPPRPQPAAQPTPDSELVRALDEIARLLALGLKRKRDLADVVADLDGVGLDRARIGELLGISPSHVDAALVAYDRRDGKKRRRRR